MTIYALSSGPGVSGVAVIRISGPETMIVLKKLTNKEIQVSRAIGKMLIKNKIYFAGIDFIQEKLIGDINVTSPTGLAAYRDLSGINLAKLFWNNL